MTRKPVRVDSGGRNIKGRIIKVNEKPLLLGVSLIERIYNGKRKKRS